MNMDPLEVRLIGLQVETPDARLLSARVLASRGKGSPRPIWRPPAVALATIALFVLILYFAPVAASVVAGVPIGGDLLREAGLVGAAGRVTSVGASSASSGYRLTLLGAYADSERTVLLLHAAPAISPGSDVTLTDQFGRSYAGVSGFGDARTGDLVLQFEPLAWPDTVVGARITLRIGHVRSFYFDAATGNWTFGPLVAGDWNLPAILSVEGAATLPSPPGGTVGGVDCTFSNVRASSATVVVDVEMHGLTPDDLDYRIPDGAKGTAVFDVELLDPRGNQVAMSWQLDPVAGGTVVHVIGVRESPGDYDLRVSYKGEVLNRTLRIGW